MYRCICYVITNGNILECSIRWYSYEICWFKYVYTNILSDYKHINNKMNTRYSSNGWHVWGNEREIREDKLVKSWE